jgi:hypothetical protein
VPSSRLLAQSRIFLVCLALAIVGVTGLGLTAVATQAAPATTNGTVAVQPTPVDLGTAGQRLLNWSGITWLVYPNCPNCGPEQTPTTNAAKALYVDSRGWLHMNVTKIDGKWRGVEMRALTDVPYGTYRWVVNSQTADLDPWAVLGMFVYRPGTAQYTNEIDIEDSRFPHLLHAPDNAQFTVQPYKPAGHQHGYYISPDYHPLLQQFTWSPAFGNETHGLVQFEARVGTTPNSPLLSRFSYGGYAVPTSENMQLFVVLWMNKNTPPTTGTHSAVIRNLTISPLGG